MSDAVTNLDETQSEEALGRARAAVSDKVGVAKERLQNVGSELGTKVRDQGERVGEYARERYGVAREKVGQGYVRARKDVDQLASDVNVYVQDNPGRAVMIAAGVGFLLGFLLRGERR